MNNAKAKKKASIDVNLAQVMAFQDVASKEAVAYGEMQSDSSIGFTSDRQLLDFVKVKTINGFNPKNLVVGIK